jgi:indole-3-glycerol phosphate synthase
MKITTYQQNARMLWEAHRVIHQQNMERLAELNRQAELQKKAYEIKTQWVKVNQVDIMA